MPSRPLSEAVKGGPHSGKAERWPGRNLGLGLGHPHVHVGKCIAGLGFCRKDSNREKEKGTIQGDGG